MGDARSKVTRRPRSKLERVLDALGARAAVVRRPEVDLGVQLALACLVSSQASAGDAPEAESHYRGWPAVLPADNGAYAAREGDDPAAADGKNTVYLAELPPDVSPGDWVRVHAHCLTHGEYVDFLQLPS